MNVDSYVHSWKTKDSIPSLTFRPVGRGHAAIAGKVIPKSLIEKRSRAHEWESASSPGWKILKSPNAVVRGDIPLHGLRAASVYAEELNVLLRSTIGRPDQSPMYSIRIFENAHDFRRYAISREVGNAEAFYDPRNAEANFCFSFYATPELFQRSFAHEFTHAFMDRMWNRTGPLWFAEGMAEYFSNLEWRGGILVVGEPDATTVETLRLGKPFPLERVFSMGRSDVYGPDFRRIYAQSWAVVEYLFARHPAEILSLLEGRPLDPAAIESDWLEYMHDRLSIPVPSSE